MKIGLPSLFPENNSPNPQLEKDLAKIKDIQIFGSVLRKPIAEAGDIDLAIDHKLTKSERQLLQQLAIKYQKPVEVWQLEPETENGELWFRVDIFWYDKKPTWTEHDLSKYPDWFIDLRPPHS